MPNTPLSIGAGLTALLMLAISAAAQERVTTAPPAERILKPQNTFKDCDSCPEMIVVPAGEFMMGSPDNEEGRAPREGPQHRVTIPAPFAVGRFPVRFDEWDFCVADGGCNGYKPRDEGWGRGRRPVINVSWDDAKAYVWWISKKTGKAYRLLSEAEREYVARAGTTTPFWWGSSVSPEQANYNALYSYGGGPKSTTYPRSTLPVDSFLPNPWGLYQVHGNVLDAVEDCWHDSYHGAPSDGSPWVTGECRPHVYRGGCWYCLPEHMRSAERFMSDSDFRGFYDSFRVARTL